MSMGEQRNLEQGEGARRDFKMSADQKRGDGSSVLDLLDKKK